MDEYTKRRIEDHGRVGGRLYNDTDLHRLESSPMHPHTLTIAMLKEAGACPAALESLKATFGASVVITEELCAAHATSVNWNWAAGRLLSAPARAEYDRITAVAGTEYNRIEAPARAEYDRATVAARAEYDPVRAAAKAAYNRIAAAVRAEYSRATAPARAEYSRIEAPAKIEYDRITESARTEYDRVTEPARAEYSRVMAVTFARLWLMQSGTPL